jgi:hypothetical protein
MLISPFLLQQEQKKGNNYKIPYRSTMPFIVSANERCGTGTQTISITYGVFSTEKKAHDAIEIFVDKLVKRHINHNHDLAYDQEQLQEEYRDYFLITKLPEIDNDLIFREHFPKF